MEQIATFCVSCLVGFSSGVGGMAFIERLRYNKYCRKNNESYAESHVNNVFGLFDALYYGTTSFALTFGLLVTAPISLPLYYRFYR